MRDAPRGRHYVWLYHCTVLLYERMDGRSRGVGMLSNSKLFCICISLCKYSTTDLYRSTLRFIDVCPSRFEDTSNDLQRTAVCVCVRVRALAPLRAFRGRHDSPRAARGWYAIDCQ